MHVHSPDLRMLRDTKFEIGNKSEILRLLTSGMFWDDPYILHVNEILDAALGKDVSNIVEIAKNNADRLFLERIISNTSSPTAIGTRVGSEYDFLMSDCHEWNLIRVINFMRMSSIPKKKRFSVLTSTRNEGVNILEWVAHYRTLAVDSIIVYTNGNDDGSDELLSLLAQAGVVTLIQNDTRLEGVGDIQKKAFEHAFNFLPELWEHEWIFFIDPDEFLLLGGGGSIPNLLNVLESDQADTQPSGMSLNWKWFGSRSELHREPGLVQARYTYSSESKFVKTVAKLREITGMATSHYPRLLNGRYFVDASLSRLDTPKVEIDPKYKLGQVNHYWNKSFEEFLVKSMRGNWDREPRLFFEWGNKAPGQYDPLPPGWLDKVQAEVDQLMALPGVRDQVEAIEIRFREIVETLDRERNIGRMYTDAKQLAGIA